MTVDNATTTRSSRLIAALACGALAALVVTAAGSALLVAALPGLQADGPAGDRTLAFLLLGIAVVLLLPPAGAMWVGLARLARQPPRGAALLTGSLRTVGGFVLAVALPTIGRAGNVGVTGAVVGIGLAFIGIAALVAAAARDL